MRSELVLDQLQAEDSDGAQRVVQVVCGETSRRLPGSDSEVENRD